MVGEYVGGRGVGCEVGLIVGRRVAGRGVGCEVGPIVGRVVGKGVGAWER